MRKFVPTTIPTSVKFRKSYIFVSFQQITACTNLTTLFPAELPIRIFPSLSMLKVEKKSFVGAARKVSPDWSQKTMTCHSINCFSIVWGQGKAPLVTPLPSSFYMTRKKPWTGLYKKVVVGKTS